MDQSRKILLNNVVVILLLHALVPHMHHEEMTYFEHEKTHENAHSIIDYLGLVFQQQVNSNLEHFTVEDASCFSWFDQINTPFSGNPIFLNFETIHSGEKKLFGTISKKSFPGCLISANGLRAPPAFDFYT